MFLIYSKSYVGSILHFVKIIHHLRFWYFEGYFFIFFLLFEFPKYVFKYTLKVGEDIFSSNLSYDPLFRFLVFLGGLFLVFVVVFWAF